LSLKFTQPTKILLAASVPVHFRAFHLPWVQCLREAGAEVLGAARDISAMPECVRAFNRVYDIPFSRSPKDARAALTSGAMLREILEKENVALVHVHTPVPALITRFYARKLRAARGLKVVYTAHGFHFHDKGKWHTNAVFSAIERMAGRWTDLIITINEDDARAAVERGIVPPERCAYIPGVGIDLDKYSPASVSEERIQAFRKELGVAPDAKLITAVAEFTPNKRQADMVAALAKLQRPDAHLVFCGVGTQLENVKRLAQTLGLARNTHFLGHRSDIPTILRASVCGILVSSREGLPRSVMEALALEVPVVGSNIRGTRDLLATGGGILVTSGDVQAIHDAFKRLLEDPELARDMGRKGRAAMAKYSLPNVLAEQERLYAQLLGL
jgi:glycosyltransferase involved in cell wall biosynthesis